MEMPSANHEAPLEPDAGSAPGPIPAWIERITRGGPKMRTALRWTLLVSLLLHVATFPWLIGRQCPKMRLDLEKSKNTYLSKMVQRERGKIRGHEIRASVQAPPAPPDPQLFAEKAIANAATKGVEQMTSKLIPVALQSSLVKHVETTLADEIREMAEKVKKRELTQAEYQKKQKDLQEKVFVVAQQYGAKMREEGQIEIASGMVTDWYEDRVARQFKEMVRKVLFSSEENRPWRIVATENPGFLRSRRDEWSRPLGYETALDLLGTILKNRFPPETKELPEECKGKLKHVEHGWWTYPDVPSLAHAAAVAFFLNRQFNAWDEDCAAYFRRFYPHRMEEMARPKAELDAAWKKLLSAAEEYRRLAASGGKPEELAKAQQAMLDLAKSLREEGEKHSLRFRSPKEVELAAVNQALRSQLVRGPYLKELHAHVVERIVDRIRPAVVNLAQNQFREGMAYSKSGVQEAIKSFGVSSVSLLRRDITEALSTALLQRGLFLVGANPYVSPLSGKPVPPSDEDVARDERTLEKIVAKWSGADRLYVEKRIEAIKTEVRTSVERAVEELLKLMVDKDGVLERDFYAKAQSVDYTDPLQVRFELRDRALKGRAQDLADISDEGLPDSQNPRVALLAAVEAGQVAVRPFLTSLHPNYYAASGRSAMALRWTSPSLATATPADWGCVEQVKVKPAFQSPAFEAIPFLVTPPKLDGDLSDWGSIRPALLHCFSGEPTYLGSEPLKLYAGWNYQGFFFGYHVPQPKKFFVRPAQYVRAPDGISLVKREQGDNRWIFAGDCLHLCFDTLDSRLDFRGDPNTQEFYIFPAGTDSDPAMPGAEEIVASRRDGLTPIGVGDWPCRPVSVKVFPPQPENGPDGTGPYRVTRQAEDGYTVEVFLPRSLFRHPVFAPGWYVGFDCIAVVGETGRGWLEGRSAMLHKESHWQHSMVPSRWGDLLLLGTDAEVRIQDAAPGWPASSAVVPGHSYLVTIIDPDHNVNPAAEDVVLLSAEVLGEQGRVDDVGVFVLKEEGKNTGVFRGFINTQFGPGRRAHGILEVQPGREVRFAYEDFGDSKGRRNLVHEIELPVVAAVVQMNGAGKE
jgi:hypothetical protein